MENIIIIAVLIVVAAFVIKYIVKSKKRGETCIGCPSAKQCKGKCNCNIDNSQAEK